VIDDVPWPPVMVPFEIAQLYVVPAGAAAALATLPVLPGQTLAGALIVDGGSGVTFTVRLAVALQPLPFVTVTV
jgi:hypothetical protein